MTTTTVYLAFGSNLGDKEQNIRRAVMLVEQSIGNVEALSSMLQTEPWGFTSANNFINAAARITTQLSLRQLLAATQTIERQLGRKEKSAEGCYHDRLIDIDILMYGNVRLAENDLVVPHPLMLQRDFVMLPLSEVLDDEGQRFIAEEARRLQPE